MTQARRIPTTHRALLKMAFQDIASGESVSAQNAHIRSITSVCWQSVDADGGEVQSDGTHASAYAVSNV